jgi:hypothetical protein
MALKSALKNSRLYPPAPRQLIYSGPLPATQRDDRLREMKEEGISSADGGRGRRR